ncbi:arabinose efflux permease family protein [Leptolyngbya sp. Heron Island J]|uniref:MFS transporter n=1 Tax=Leptolyngbya sp. Heron Island J TaxID=1385935 RepID=UPI0003B9BA6A|nr:MFS transporter [Leptolyngbya sp. Heron Island J]ESA37299.1 arabinose efflux permease family protein [Leptolyngbya sp. Heron Island J]
MQLTKPRVLTWQKMGLLGSLYVAQHIPLTFVYEALPVFLRQQNVSLRTLGLLQLLALPLVFKFLWSPLIDRYGVTRWRHYRFWILCFQTGLGGVIALLAFLNITQQFTLLLIGLLLVSLLSASQDIGTDALAVGLLSPAERGIGNGIQRGGNSLGAIIGGGGMLLLLSYWGWRITLLAMAAVLLLAVIPIARHREQVIKPALSSPPSFGRLISVYRRPGMGRWSLILLLYGIGPYMALTMFRPLLVDIGLSMGEIGLLLGVVSYGAGLLGAVAAGLNISRLGRKQALVIFSALQGIAIAAYCLPALGFTQLPILYVVAMIAQFINGMAMTALFTVMMDNSEATTAGTDYTVQSSVVYISGILGATFSGVIAETIGYQGVFAVALLFAVVTVLAISYLFR